MELPDSMLGLGAVSDAARSGAEQIHTHITYMCSQAQSTLEGTLHVQGTANKIRCQQLQPAFCGGPDQHNHSCRALL
jgi:hypothetical protein